jgi:hypothetical protein
MDKRKTNIMNNKILACAMTAALLSGTAYGHETDGVGFRLTESARSSMPRNAGEVKLYARTIIREMEWSCSTLKDITTHWDKMSRQPSHPLPIKEIENIIHTLEVSHRSLSTFLNGKDIQKTADVNFHTLEAFRKFDSLLSFLQEAEQTRSAKKKLSTILALMTDTHEEMVTLRKLLISEQRIITPQITPPPAAVGRGLESATITPIPKFDEETERWLTSLRDHPFHSPSFTYHQDDSGSD